MKDKGPLQSRSTSPRSRLAAVKKRGSDDDKIFGQIKKDIHIVIWCSIFRKLMGSNIWGQGSFGQYIADGSVTVAKFTSMLLQQFYVS